MTIVYFVFPVRAWPLEQLQHSTKSTRRQQTSTSQALSTQLPMSITPPWLCVFTSLSSWRMIISTWSGNISLSNIVGRSGTWVIITSLIVTCQGVMTNNSIHSCIDITIDWGSTTLEGWRLLSNANRASRSHHSTTPVQKKTLKYNLNQIIAQYCMISLKVKISPRFWIAFVIRSTQHLEMQRWMELSRVILLRQENGLRSSSKKKSKEDDRKMPLKEGNICKNKILRIKRILLRIL